MAILKGNVMNGTHGWQGVQDARRGDGRCTPEGTEAHGGLEAETYPRPLGGIASAQRHVAACEGCLAAAVHRDDNDGMGERRRMRDMDIWA